MDITADVVIVGAGVGGSTLAANLAAAGLALERLEREQTFVDRVRGGWMAPWGVAETRRLGVYDALMAAGGHHVTRAVNYDELLAPAQAEAAMVACDDWVADAPGALCMEHMAMQNALLDHARAMQRLAAEPALSALIAAALMEPETVPPEVFTATFQARIVGP